MPYLIRKNKNQNTYKVANALTGKIHAYAIKTKDKALKFVKLLYFFAHGK